MFRLTNLLLVVIGMTIGILMGISHMPFYWPLIILIAFILAYALLYLRNAYFFLRSKNMVDVEKILHRYRKRPNIAFLLETLNGNYEGAEKILDQIKNEQQKTIGQILIYLEKKEFDLAKQENQKIKNEDVRSYNNALIALKEGDLESFHLYLEQVKNKASSAILKANEAFKRGDFKEAERFGKLAISMTSGVKRYVLQKSYERQLKNPYRETYF